MYAKLWIIGLLALVALPVCGQQSAITSAPGQIDIELGYSADPNNLTDGKRILLQGGNVELVGHLRYGFAGVASVTGLHTGSSVAGVPQNLVVEVFGPRFTFAGRGRLRERTSAFAQALIGEANGFRGVFPGKNGGDSSGNGFALKVGGGLEVAFREHLHLRVFQVDFLQTRLPNGTTDLQRSAIVGAGLVWHTNQR